MARDRGAGPTSSRSTAAKAAPAPRRSCSPITSRCRSSSASRGSTRRSPRGARQDVVFIGSGKLGFPDAALLALALGCDMVNVAREAMMAIGCIQAQRCHTGHCPTGVATQSAWLMRGLDPTLKSARLANYLRDAAQRAARARARVRRRASGARRPRPARDRLRALQRRAAARGVRLRARLGGAAAGAPRGDRGADERARGLACGRAGAGPGARRRDGRGHATPRLAGAAAALPAGIRLAHVVRLSFGSSRARAAARARPGMPASSSRLRSRSELSSIPNSSAMFVIHSHTSSHDHAAERAVGLVVGAELRDVERERRRRDDPHDERDDAPGVTHLKPGSFTFGAEW